MAPLKLLLRDTPPFDIKAQLLILLNLRVHSAIAEKVNVHSMKCGRKGKGGGNSSSGSKIRQASRPLRLLLKSKQLLNATL